MSARSCRIWLLCLGLFPAGGRASAAEPAKPPEVPVARPVAREVTDYEDFTGRTGSCLPNRDPAGCCRVPRLSPVTRESSSAR